MTDYIISGEVYSLLLNLLKDKMSQIETTLLKGGNGVEHCRELVREFDEWSDFQDRLQKNQKRIDPECMVKLLPNKKVRCSVCKGTGKVPLTDEDLKDINVTRCNDYKKCEICMGEGYL